MAGGGARSTLWRQIVADVFGLPVVQLLFANQSACGAALLAGGGLGIVDLAAHNWAACGPPVEPEPGRHSRYRELFSLFRSAYAKHRTDFARLKNLDQD
jgi:xylulokinase